MDYKYKYQKYKNKYLNIKKKILGGGYFNLHNKLNLLNNSLIQLREKKIEQGEEILKEQEEQRIKADIASSKNMINHILTYDNKTIHHIKPNENLKQQFLESISFLNNHYITPKVVIVIGHGVVNEKLEKFTLQNNSKIVQLYDNLIRMKVDNVFIVDFIEYIINNIEIFDDGSILELINNFKKHIQDKWNTYNWSVSFDSFPYLLTQSETIIIKDDKKLSMNFSLPGDGLVIIGTTPSNENYYYFVKIPLEHELSRIEFKNWNMNQNNLNFREIIELFDSSDSPVYFIPISCQNIVNENNDDDEWTEDGVTRITHDKKRKLIPESIEMLKNKYSNLDESFLLK